MFKPYFKPEDLRTISTLIIEGGVNSQKDIDGLLVGLPAPYLAQLPTEDNPASRLLKILNEINHTEIMDLDELPIQTFLANAIYLLNPRTQVTKLKIYQHKINHAITCHRLAELIDQCGVVDDELEQIYQFCMCDRGSLNANIDEMAEHLLRAKHRYGRQGFAALLFAYLLAHHSVDNAAAIGLEQWIDETAVALGFQVNSNMFEQYVDEFKSQIAQREYEQTRLMVMITSATVDAQDIEINMYWKYQNQRSEKCLDAPGTIRDLSELPDVIEEVLGGRIHCTVEMFLPKELMGYNLEYPKERHSLLVTHKIIRRFAERQIVDRPKRVRQTLTTLKQIEAKNHWEKKWQRFRGSIRNVEQHHFWIEQAHMAYENDLYQDLTDPNQEICCTSPSFTPKDQLTKLLGYNLQAGIPICFWSEHEQIDHKATLGPCLVKPKEGFRNSIQRLQYLGLKSSDAMRKGRLLYLLWDDPDNPFPGMEAGVSVRQA